MLTNILPGMAAKTLADNGSFPALQAGTLAALIDGTPVTGYTFGGQSYTANLCAGGTPIGVYYTGFPPSYAFDGNGATYWCSDTLYIGWVGYQFPTAKTITKVRLLPFTDGSTYSAAKDFTVDGSNDGTTWNTVYTGITALVSGWQEFLFSNVTGYTYWRVRITSNYGGSQRPTLHELEMMESATGSLKVLLDISASTPATEIRYVTDETDTTKVTIKGSTDGVTYTTYSATASGAGYLSAAVGGLMRYVTIDHVPAAAKTAYEIQVIAQRLEKQIGPFYRIFQTAQKIGVFAYSMGSGAPILKQAGVAYGIYQPLMVKRDGRYHVLQRTDRSMNAAYHSTQPTLKARLARYCVRPPVPALFDPASGSLLEMLSLGLFHPGETTAEFMVALWNDKGMLNSGLKMSGVRITASLEREGQFTGGNDADGQEFVGARWLELRSSGVTGTGIADDAQATFTPVGGDPFTGGLLVGDIPPNSARYLHCRVNVPAQVATAHTSRPRLLAVYQPAPVCGFGKNHGTEFGG